MVRIRKFSNGDERACRRVIESNCEAVAQQCGKAVADDLMECNSLRRLREKSRESFFVVAADGPRVIGMSRLEPNGVVGNVYVLHSKQRRGIGSAIIHRPENEAKQQGLNAIGAGVLSNAQNFYEKHGFRKSGKNVVRAGNKTIAIAKMTKCIAREGVQKTATAFFKSHDRRIRALVDLPKERKCFPVLVLCHGFLGHPKQKLLAIVAKRFCQAGFAVIRFFFTNANAEKPGKNVPPVHWHEQELRDALAFARNLQGADAKRVFLAGHSYGANVCLLVARDDPHIKALVLFAPGRELKEYAHLFENGVMKLFGKALVVTNRARRDWLEADLDYAVHKSRRKTFVVAANPDDFVPLPSLQKRFAGFETRVLKGTDHFFNGSEEKAAAEALLFLEKKVCAKKSK
ncbi:hypothetical protein AUJ65_02785 [Candidatus Micrarchaeota archaeon CG1_02_51_15]|nr:MAG: hypothetical protein AUJ65_02785 [Candidatus Micrarchaeota archaeon CG1_02_51_15]